MSKPEGLKTINVIYKFIDGAHFFVSDEKQAQGLCVAHNDMKTAYEEVGYQLSALAKFNLGISATYSPSLPFDSFKKVIEAFDAVRKVADDSGKLTTAAIQPWQIAKMKELAKEPA